MDGIQVSKHFKNGRHDGFRKYVYGRMFHLGTGTTAAHEARAKIIAGRLLAHAETLRRLNGIWTEAAITEAYDVPAVIIEAEKPETALTATVVATTPPPAPIVPPAAPVVVIPVVARQVVPPHFTGDSIWLYAAMELYKEAERLRERSNDTSKPNSKNYISRIEWSKEGIKDRPMDELRHVSDLKAWRGHFTARPISKKYGRPIAPSSAYAVCQAIRHFLDWCDVERLWVPCHRWRDAFKGVSVKKLSTPVERNKKKREGFFNFDVREMRFIWHASLHHNRVFIGLGLWCGHTQNELATILLEGEFFERGGELYLERDRHKTGVYGKWWIPPELALLVKERLKLTPRDLVKNPNQAAFLMFGGRPLVHYSKTGKGTRSDAVAQFWGKTLDAVEFYGVRYHSFKYLRKTMAQQVRDRLGVEFATMFSAEKIEGVQDEHYTNASFVKLERCMREEIYPIWKEMFKPFSREELGAERERIEGLTGPVAAIADIPCRAEAVAV